MATLQPRFGYLLLTHKDASHVEDLADRILGLSPRAHVIVHHDAGAPDLPWGGNPVEPFHLVERRPVLWGDWSMVAATIRLLRYATDNTDADWFVLLSGQHRPVLDLEGWENTTARSGIDAFARADRLPSQLRYGRNLDEKNAYLARSRHRWKAVPRPRNQAGHRAMGAVMKLGRFAHPLFAVEYVHRREAWVIGTRRRLGCMRGQQLHRGSQWIVLNRRAAEVALNVDPAVSAWFRKSWIPDETYFHTVLRRDPQLVVSNALMTFVLETPERPTPGWMRLNKEHLPAVWASGAPFARKVDPSERPEVMALIDEAVDRLRAGPPARRTAGAHGQTIELTGTAQTTDGR